MRSMNEFEIDRLLGDVTWGTLCGVLPRGVPYAAEVTFFCQNDEIISLSHSAGMTGDCIRHCPQVCFKVCDSGRLSRNFRAASLFGEAFFHLPASSSEMIGWWEKLEQRLGSPDRYLRPKQRCREEGRIYPVLRVRISHRTGITDWDCDDLHAN